MYCHAGAERSEAIDHAGTAPVVAGRWRDNVTELRRYVEDTLVVQDPVELWVAQNLVLDGLLYPLVYEKFDAALTAEAGPTVSMLLRFQVDWFAETSKWVDATVKTAAAESPENAALLAEWIGHYRDRAVAALAPVAELALGADGAAAMADVQSRFAARVAKCGVAL